MKLRDILAGVFCLFFATPFVSPVFGQGDQAAVSDKIPDPVAEVKIAPQPGSNPELMPAAKPEAPVATVAMAPEAIPAVEGKPAPHPQITAKAEEHPGGDATQAQKAVLTVETGQPVAAEAPQPATTAPAERHKYADLNPPLAISLDLKDRSTTRALERSFQLYTGNLRERFSIWLERSGRYMEVMKQVLAERDMPQELVYLPIVESGFNTQAYSRARAAGPWQFIAGTAKRYGLTIDWWRDERKDPIKSTVAAASYLNDLYGMFGSWSLALAAYNAGEGKIAKALRRSDSEDYWDLLDTKHIRQETKDYVPRYIAASIIANKPEEYGFEDLSYHAPFEFDEVSLDGPVDLEVIAECADTTVQEIRELNPELRRWSTPPNVKGYTIRIPKGSKEDFLDNLAEYEPEERFSCDYYTVKKKDTVKTIANRAGVPVQTVLALNSLGGIERLNAGDRLMLPPKGKFTADIEDRMLARKAALKKKKGVVKGKKVAVKKSSKKAAVKSKKSDKPSKVAAKKTAPNKA